MGKYSSACGDGKGEAKEDSKCGDEGERARKLEDSGFERGKPWQSELPHNDGEASEYHTDSGPKKMLNDMISCFQLPQWHTQIKKGRIW